MKLRIKIITGFRKDQEHSIPAEEAHKAYFLFLNPQQRGIFSTGLALTGDQIKSIIPDLHGTMGWNPTHQLDSADYAELRRYGVEEKLNQTLVTAKNVAQAARSPLELMQPLQLEAQN